MSKKIVITGGGTGGHVFPALAIAQELQRRGFALSYVGTAKGMEARLVPEKGIPFHTVRTGSVKNQSVGKIFRTFVQLFFALLWAWRFLGREKPSAVIGVGGYVSVPVCVAAWLRRIPVYLQEQNVSVGIANRFLGRLSRKVFLGFAEARTSFADSKCVVSGNPIRQEFSVGDFPAHDPHANTLLILGGSQGAIAINEVVLHYLERLQQDFPGLSIIHQTGVKDLERVRKAYEQRFQGKFEVSAFIHDVPAAYAKASLVISRSGALTVSELIQVARPAILIPYPRLGQNDQTANAAHMETRGAARVVLQGERFQERFWEAVSESFRPPVLAKMSDNSRLLRSAGALATIADEIQADL